MVKQKNIWQAAHAKRLTRLAFVTIILLFIPFAAMQFSNEVQWDGYDFFAAGALIMGAGLLYEFVTRAITKKRDRIILASLLSAGLLLVWAELAVGIFS